MKYFSPETRAKISAALKGHTFSLEAIAKMKKSLTGRKLSPEHRANISAGQKGRKLSPEWIAKIAASNKGKKRSPETCAKIGNASRGRKHSVEHCAKISAGNKGKVRTPEMRAKYRICNRGRMVSEETRIKLSNAFIGKRLSEETKKKLSIYHLRNPVRYWAGKKKGPLPAKTRAKISASNYGHPAYFSRDKTRFVYGGLQMRSSYEVRVASALDILEVKWKYEPKRFSFGGFVYTPDFYLPEDDAYWEVKGWYGPDSRKKVEAFRAEYPEVPLVLIMLPTIEQLERSAMKRRN